MICPRCSYTNAPGAPSCARCGLPFAQQPPVPVNYPPAQPGYPPPQTPPYGGYPPQASPYPPGYGFYPPPPPLKKGPNPILARLPVLGSLVVLVCFFLNWVNFPTFLIFGFSATPPTESQVRAVFQQAGFSSDDLDTLTRVGMMAVSGNISGLNLIQANTLICPLLNSSHTGYNTLVPDESARQLVSLLSTGVSFLILIPLTGLIGLLMLSGKRWSRILAQWCAFLALSFLGTVVIAVFAMQTPDLPLKLNSLIGTGVWGTLGGLAWQFFTPWFVRG